MAVSTQTNNVYANNLMIVQNLTVDAGLSHDHFEAALRNRGISPLLQFSITPPIPRLFSLLPRPSSLAPF